MGLQQLFHFFHAVVDGINIRQAQFRINDLDVPDRIHAALHVGHVFIFKTAHHFRDGVGVADVAQELVAQAFALGRALHQPRDIHKMHNGRRDLPGIKHFGQHLQPLIWNGHHAFIGLNGAEGVIGRLRPGFGDGVEQCAFTYVGKPDDAYI